MSLTFQQQQRVRWRKFAGFGRHGLWDRTLRGFEVNVEVQQLEWLMYYI